MPVIRLDIADFRNFVSAKLEPIVDGFNFIYGNNGSGKTSLLEAIYYLSLGRSFRSSVMSRIVGNTAHKFSLFAHILNQTAQIIPVGMERHVNGDTKIRISGNEVRSVADLATLTPIQLINSHCFNLLDAPAFRRKFLDWGAFYAYGDFFRIWKQFERALKQRNAALRKQVAPRELAIWTDEVIQYARPLDKLRKEYVQHLLPLLNSMVSELLALDNFDVSYHPGWRENAEYADVLAETLERDRVLGHTQYGPHRADFKIAINHAPAKDILSRGQQKLFVCAMLLAQGALLNIDTNKRPIYLVDDLPSELDITSRSKLLTLLSRQNAQIFVTAVEQEILKNFLVHHPTKMFHVEHGVIAERV